MNALREYILSVAAAGLLLALLGGKLLQGRIQKIAEFVGCLILVLTVLSPLAEVDAGRLAKAMTELHMQTEAVQSGIVLENRELLADIIKKRCEEYIWDKANGLGVTLTIEITLSDGTDYPYPVGVKLQGGISDEKKALLTAIIETDLGIPAERQEWISM